MANLVFFKRCAEKFVKYSVGFYIFHPEERMICTGTVRIDSENVSEHYWVNFSTCVFHNLLQFGFSLEDDIA